MRLYVFSLFNLQHGRPHSMITNALKILSYGYAMIRVGLILFIKMSIS